MYAFFFRIKSQIPNPNPTQTQTTPTTITPTIIMAIINLEGVQDLWIEIIMIIIVVSTITQPIIMDNW